MNSVHLTQYQKTTRLAGLIDQRYTYGPDMPMDAKALARLPLAQLRRVLPEDPHSFWLNIIETQVSNAVIDSSATRLVSGEFLYFGENKYEDLVFKLWREGKPSEECDDCDGDGYFEHGCHEYECKECDGEGTLESNPNNAVATVVISRSGVIHWDECENVSRRLAI